jgi:putative ABC transport system substrate-binding protein
MLRNYCLFIIIFLLLDGSAPANERIIALQSLDVKPYNEALRGFRGVCSADMKRLVVSGMRDSDILRAVRESGAALVLAVGSEALKKAKGITDMPVVFMMVLNPQSFSGPNENVTGVGMRVSPEIQLAFLKKTLPRAKRIGVLFDPRENGPFAKRARAAASDNGIVLVSREIRSARDFPELLRGMKDEINAYWMLPDPTDVTPETLEFLLLFSIENRIPVVTFSEKYVETGALASIEIDPFDVGRQAGEMAKKILAGTPAKDLPREYARKGVLSINLRVAAKLGISFSDEVRDGAKILNGGHR